MMNQHPDTDMGLTNIFAEMDKLKSMCVKVGVTEETGGQAAENGATLAEIASWNEFGVLGPPVSQHGDGVWFIPPRPFVRGWIDGKREQVAKKIDNLARLVMDGKMKAETAMAQLGEFGQSGIRSYFRTGRFTPNADSTIAKKDSSKPLIDNGTLRNSIRYQVIEKPIGQVSEK